MIKAVAMTDVVDGKSYVIVTDANVLATNAYTLTVKGARRLSVELVAVADEVEKLNTERKARVDVLTAERKELLDQVAIVENKLAALYA